MDDFTSMNIDISYVSCGENNISTGLIVPALKRAKLYRRATGFFSSSVFCSILDGMEGLIDNKGRIELIVSPNLTEEDAKAIEEGYEARNNCISNKVKTEFNKALLEMNDSCFQITTELIKNNLLDVKIAYCAKQRGMYHDKLCIISDFSNNHIVFHGSPNATYSGISGEGNYEKIYVFRSWGSELKYVTDAINEFEVLWNNKSEQIDTFDFTDFIKTRVLEIIKNSERPKKSKNKNTFELREYQKDAIDKWVDNNYKGFFVMATGTGKTLTAVYAAKKLIEERNPIIVVVAPYLHLIEQWKDDIKKHLNPDYLIGVSSDPADRGWDRKIDRLVLQERKRTSAKIVFVSTQQSFSMQFGNFLKNFEGEKLLIVDEAHRFIHQLNPELHSEYKYMIGLSATPVSGRDPAIKNKLLNFFGGVVANLPIEEALAKNYLCKYNYYPIFVNSTSDEETQFKNVTRQIAAAYRDNKLIISETQLNQLILKRQRILATAKEKNDHLGAILEEACLTDHFIVYCGDGRINLEDGDEERHIQFVKKILDEKKYKMSQFTNKEDRETRMRLINSFTDKDIDGMVAIRCLDEGIDIPSIKKAVILASKDNIREFIQRRGRILRKYKDKTIADIYDVIVLPSDKCPKIAEIELRRFYEYARLAENHDEKLKELEEYISQYNLREEDIYHYFDTVDESMEADLDE